MYRRKRFKAVVLAAGSGLRMKSDTRKQYLKINGMPMVVYSLKAFEHSPVEEIALVVCEGEQQFCRDEIVSAYGLKKVTQIVAGGKERYHSTANALAALSDCDYVMIHDAARPCLTADVITRCMDAAIDLGACTAGVPTVDTISIVNERREIAGTPDRNSLWSIQTPQVFPFHEIRRAHELLREMEPGMSFSERRAITDDVSILKRFLHKEVHIVDGSYENIKVTTPVDLKIAEMFL